MIRMLLAVALASVLTACETQPVRELHASVKDIFQPSKGQDTLKSGLRQYEEGKYGEAAKNLHSALELGLSEREQLGRYVIQSELGRGAMGVVYKATDSVLQRTVAVKTVNMALEKDGAEQYEARFYQEARAAGGLNHPAI